MAGLIEGERPSDKPRTATGARRISLKRVLESGRYLIVIGVVVSLVGSAAGFVWGAYKTAVLLIGLVGAPTDAQAAAGFIAIMDKFLIAAGLYIFAVGMYELFIDDLDLPAWLVTHSLHHIKTRLSSIIILLLAMIFLEHVIEWKNPQEILLNGIGIAVIIAALIAFNLFGEKE